MATEVIKIDASDVEKVVGELQKVPKEILPAVSRIVNRTMDGTMTQIKKGIAAEYTIKQKDIASAATKKRGGGRKRATVNDLSSSVIFAGGQTGLYKFKHKPLKTPVRQKYRSPVTVQIKKNGGENIVGHNGNKAFMQNIKSKDGGDNHTIFAREGKKRLPIKKLYALAVPQMISPPLAKKVQKLAGERLNREITREINYRLEKAGKKK
jgi:hypothetical protein